MKAIQIDRYGGPDVLVRRDIAVPALAAGEVLIRVTHAGINFMDIHTRQGKYAASRTYRTTLPCTLGMEGAGVVAAVGAAVAEFRTGDRVADCMVWGSYAEYAAAPGWRVAGVAAAVGARVAASRPGDRVGYGIVWGSYAGYAAAPAWRVVKVPAALPLEMAAASLFHGFTAHYLAHDVAHLGPGITCLVHAASGGIGQLLI